jgi:hypothetical protein
MRNHWGLGRTFGRRVGLINYSTGREDTNSLRFDEGNEIMK